MSELISQIDSLYSIDEKLNCIGHCIEGIQGNTDSLSGWSLMFTMAAFIASIATICGVVSIYHVYYQRKTNKSWQRKIVLDLLRHFMVNNAIVEVVRSRMQGQPNTFHPVEGVFSRFATLDSDMDLARFAVTESNYETIHHLSLLIRNYNDFVRLADKHFCDGDYPAESKERELDEILKRSIQICKGLKILCTMQDVELTPEIITGYITDSCYGKSVIDDWKTKGLYVDDFPVPERDYPESYYDELGLTEIFKHLIRHKAAVVPFIDYSK